LGVVYPLFGEWVVVWGWRWVPE